MIIIQLLTIEAVDRCDIDQRIPILTEAKLIFTTAKCPKNVTMRVTF